MAKEPGQRFASMEDFASAVWPEQPVTSRGPKTAGTTRPRGPVTSETPTEAVALAGAPTTPIPSATPAPRTAPRPAASRPKKSGAGVMIAVMVLAGAGVGGYFALRGRDGAKPTAAAPTPSPVPAPLGPVVRDLRLDPATATLRPGGRVTLTATPVDAGGAPVAGQRVEWSSSDQRIARVDSQGRVTAVAAGLALIDAKVGDVHTQAAVQVQAPAAVVTPPRPPPQAPPVAAVEEGYLSIDAIPYGNVFIDNVEIGPTPIARYAVRPGQHTIRVENPGFKTKTERVQVDKGNTVRKRYTLDPEG
jgi:hypothetical protein